MKLPIKYLAQSTFVLLLATVSFIGCKSDKSPDSKQSQDQTTNTSSEKKEGEGVHIASSHASIMLGMWHYAKMVADPEVVELYRGRWIDFKRDDTFVSGIYDKQTNSGTWSLTDDSSSNLSLKFDKEEEGVFSEWQVQGGGDYVVWKGNAGSNQSGFQIKMVLDMEGNFPVKK